MAATVCLLPEPGPMDLNFWWSMWDKQPFLMQQCEPHTCKSLLDGARDYILYKEVQMLPGNLHIIFVVKEAATFSCHIL
eukprot:11936619-Ditylum_brightwellii.AAC.1